MGSKRAKSKQESGNKAYQPISEALTPTLGYVQKGGDAVSNLLGLNGGPAQTEGLEKFSSSGGMDFIREQGQRQIEGSQASKGLFASGDTGRELAKFGQGLGSTYLKDYISSLFEVSKTGLGSAGAMSSAGNWSTGSSKGPKKGMFEMMMENAGGAIKAATGGKGF